MRALLVTSAVTLVPRNYNDVVVGVAGCPELVGLLELDNRSPKLWATGLALIAGGAPRTGGQLLHNLAGRSRQERRRAWRAHGKPVHRLVDINSEAAVQLVIDEGIDLLVNARTRAIYRADILRAPRLGAINVHHGLLPAQRGLMCDLWALYDGEPAGFSVHQMSRRIDAGGLLHTETVDDGRDRDYLAYLRRSACREAAVLPRILRRIAADNGVRTCPNPRDPERPHRTNPTPAEIRQMRGAGLLL